MAIGLFASLAEADEGRRRGGRRRGQRQRGGRQQQITDLGPPPQPIIDIPEVPAAPLPLNRFVPTGPAPGSAFPPESPVEGHIPDSDGNYDFA